MKKAFLLFIILASLHASSQSVFGYWYGTANVDVPSKVSNYLVELVLQPEKGNVKGVLNYYFKNIYRSIEVKGKYNAVSRELTILNVPVVYFGSPVNKEVDCIMNFRALLRVAVAGSTLSGRFEGLPENYYVCAPVNFTLTMNAEASKTDSVIKAIREFKEIYQVWQPALADTLVAANIVQRKVVNYVVENQFKEREEVVSDEIEVESDTLKVDFYDNGEVDGDSISVFFNKELLAFSQKLSARSIHFNLSLDSLKQVNELSMFANNLGAIPPNTALMIIDDGKNKFNIRLSSNLEKNATIRIKRKKDGVKAKQ
ncbi:MAG: hypothetical protein JNN00_04945 [Chitinophagaceae bacterium]|nr:hypothetical protein [Chitinophagaceae bacterium]